MLTWIMIGIAALFILFLVNKRAVSRIGSAANSQISKGARSIWAIDPIAVKNQEIDNLADELVAAKDAAVDAQALVEGVERQVKVGKMELAKLNALAEQYTREGNDEKALDKLTEIENAQAVLSQNEQQLESHKKTLATALNNIKNANKRIFDLKKEAQSQGVQLKMAKANASIHELSQSFGKSKLDFSKLSEVNEEINKQIDTLNAKTKVNTELTQEDNEEFEVESRIRSESAKKKLQEMKAKMKV